MFCAPKHLCTCMHAFMHLSTHTYIHPYIHASIHTYVRRSIHPYIHTCIRTYIHVLHTDRQTDRQPHMYTYVYVRLYVCICMYVCMYACTYVCMHADTASTTSIVRRLESEEAGIQVNPLGAHRNMHDCMYVHILASPGNALRLPHFPVQFRSTAKCKRFLWDEGRVWSALGALRWGFDQK